MTDSMFRYFSCSSFEFIQKWLTALFQVLFHSFWNFYFIIKTSDNFISNLFRLFYEWVYWKVFFLKIDKQVNFYVKKKKKKIIKILLSIKL
mgnify:FL=1